MCADSSEYGRGSIRTLRAAAEECPLVISHGLDSSPRVGLCQYYLRIGVPLLLKPRPRHPSIQFLATAAGRDPMSSPIAQEGPPSEITREGNRTELENPHVAEHSSTILPAHHQRNADMSSSESSNSIQPSCWCCRWQEQGQERQAHSVVAQPPRWHWSWRLVWPRSPMPIRLPQQPQQPPPRWPNQRRRWLRELWRRARAEQRASEAKFVHRFPRVAKPRVNMDLYCNSGRATSADCTLDCVKGNISLSCEYTANQRPERGRKLLSQLARYSKLVGSRAFNPPHDAGP